MTSTMSTTEAGDKFSDLLGRVQTGNEVIVVEQDGRPVAVVISPDQYERYREAARGRFFQTVDQIRADNAAEDPDQIYDDVTTVVEQVRQEQYDRERRV